MKKNIFISSTFRDLQEYRAEIWNLLQKYKDRINVLGMEAFGARKDAPIDTCIQEVQRADIYIGIIGVRYGSVDSRTNKSFTQLEYEAAIVQGCDIWIYFMDLEKCTIHPCVFDCKNIRRLNAFKGTLKKHTYDVFENPDDLKLKIYNKIKEAIPLSKDLLLPTEIPCLVSRFEISGETWVFVKGIYKGNPVQLFAVLADDFWIPQWVTNGYLLNVKYSYDGGPQKNRTDFLFEDTNGYKIIVEGLSRTFDPSIFTPISLISELLLHEASPERINDLVTRLEFPSLTDSTGFKIALKQILLPT